MGALLGRSITLAWDGNEVAGVREKGVNMNGEPVDITSDEDGGWRTLLAEAGQSQVDISVSGVTKSSELRNAWNAGGDARQKVLTLTYPDGSEISALFNLVSYQETGPYKEATTFEASFQSAEEVDYSEAAAPSNTIKPAISGVLVTGQTLTALVGEWVGAVSFAYQWKNAGVNINGATGRNYVLQASDEADEITVAVTATNSQGSATATSAAVIPAAA